MGNSVERHVQRACAHEHCGKLTYLFFNIVYAGDKARTNRQGRREKDAYADAEENELPDIAFCQFYIARSQGLPDHNGHRSAHRHEKYVEQVCYSAGDVEAGDYHKAARREYLHEHGHAERPQQFIGQQRHTFNGNITRKFFPDAKAAVNALHKEETLTVRVRPYRHDAQFHKAAEHGCDRRSLYSKLGKAEIAVDQEVIENEVDKQSRDACRHWQNCFSCFTQSPAVALSEREGKQA